jgi:subtilase family serine protease
MLRGNVHPLAQAHFDVGVAPASAKVDRLMLILKRSPQQDAALTAFLHDVQNSDSAQFHRFLTPEEFGTHYGPSNADVAAVRQWLQSHGFTVAGVNKGRTAIEFSGTVGQLQQAFQTTIHRYNVGGAEHWANVSDPQVPAALAPVVGGVAALNDFKPMPYLVKGPPVRWDQKLHRFAPELTGTSSGTQVLLVGPGDAATIYNTPNSLNTHLASGQSIYDGTGVTIGIAGTTQLDTGVIFYRNFFGQGQNYATTVYDGSQSNIDPSADETEATADVEIAGALAPGANIIYYAAGDTAFQSGLFLAIYRAIDDNQINILNVSYGACEAALGASGNLQVLNAWEQAAAQGIVVTVSTGDSGSAGCDNQNLVTAASHGLAVNGLASTPYNIAVGGTDFDSLQNGFSKYVGNNTSNYTSALSYIPENPWNDSTSTNGALSANAPLKNSSGQTSIWAAGGGASSGYPKPSWQQGFTPSNTDTARDVPDVTLFSGVGHYGAMWALCEGTDCSSGSTSTIHGVGGTSTAAPALAGILALVNQKAGASTRLGQANWVLYKLAQTTPSIFHPINKGNISVYCASGTPNCTSNNFLSGYNAQSSYSLATGLGSVDASLLVNQWTDNSLASTTTTLGLDQTTFQHGTPIAITANVNPNSATGNISITNNYSSQPQAAGSTATAFLTLNGGMASGTFSQLPGGSYNVYANYGGDGTFAGSVSQPVAVKVTPENSTLQFQISSVSSVGQLVNASGATLPLGTFITMNAMPIGASQSGRASPITNATGTVTFSDTATGYTYSWNAQARLDSSGTAETNTVSLPAGTHSIVATYSGDLSYNSSTAAPITFTLGKVPTTISVSSSAASTVGQNVTVTAQIAASTSASSPYASGMVTFTNTTNNTVLGTNVVTAGCSGTHTTMCSWAFIDIDSTKLVAGANNIVASYAGDSNFGGSGPSAPVTVTCNASCWNQSGQRLGLGFYNQSSGTIVAGGTVTATVSVGQSGGFTGDVNLSCTVSGQSANDQHVPTCSFNPTKVAVSTQAVQSQLTISTTARTTSANVHGVSSSPLYSIGGLSLASLFVVLLPSRRLRHRYLVILLVLLLSTGYVTACGGSSGGSSGGGGSSSGGGGGTNVTGTTADTYRVTFTAVDAATGTVTAQDYFNFVVN